ncbi:MAG: alpha-L-fucosidase [Defluviitaleaceae bacterium]|nr:alpha-L-fucosidase [Defluviitaleaceae bacterium]
MPDTVIQGLHGSLQEKDYIKPDNPVTLQQLEWFQDQKLALMMHWGIYSQLGMVESWALSDQDSDWSRGGVDWDVDVATFKKQYRDLNKSFNPIRFEPDKWARAAKEGGFKYLIFTTKHHDGFCMWDTKQTDYKVTNRDCPFSVNKRADIVSHVFEAFRRQRLGIAAYFSKADWDTPYYWPKDQFKGQFTGRGPSYDPADNPELWEKFVQFTHNQIMELVTNYGRIDILWFDAGWVRRPRKLETGRYNQDIRIEEMIEKARKVQPWLLSADRTVGGICENYITPEQSVPSRPLSVPWESCISMGNGFAYSYDDKFKSTKTLLRMLINIVSKGGNLALNVAPQTDGRLPWPALQRMDQMGKWLKQYGSSIYGTRITQHFVGDGVYWFTQKAAENKVYAFYTPDGEGFDKNINIPYNEKKVLSVKNLTTGEDMPFNQNSNHISVKIDEAACSELFGGEHIAEVFEFIVEGGNA